LSREEISLDIEIGDIVYSKAGRDTGHIFVVCGTIDRNFVLVADGNLRKLEKPKKKRLKHLKPTGLVLDDMKNKVGYGVKMGNAELRRALEHEISTDSKGE
jgi:ribosomal protein L14E/L6E/L27E